MKLGFIGVGNIGAPIASQLLAAGHSLVVHDLRPEAAQALLRAGAIWADDLSPISHPAMSRVGWSFEPVRLGVATGRGA
jgi:3-hydroxyisobutyrate dehydrogenase-like beta-hydroxyacid dehydrogenase